MKAFLALAVTCVLIACGPAHAASVTSPLMGRWSLDTSHMAIPPDARPQKVDITFSDAGDHRVSMDVAIVYANGEQVHSTGIASLDGTPVAVAGSPEADSASMKRPEPNVLVLGLSKAGIPASTRVYTVAPDGKRMTEIMSAVGPDGRPVLRSNDFTRSGVIVAKDGT